MPGLSKDIIALLQYLVPGFLAAWVVYGLTSHSKPSQFERIVQALIFTVAIQVMVNSERVALEFLGNWISFGPWNKSIDLMWSLISALLLGVLIALLTNTDQLHKCLREKGISTRSAHPSEWCGVLSEHARYIVLHLNDGKKLYGWPNVWPSTPKKGHFFVINPSWLDDDNNELPIDGVEGVLIDVESVKWVEIMKEPEQ